MKRLSPLIFCLLMTLLTGCFQTENPIDGALPETPVQQMIHTQTKTFYHYTGQGTLTLFAAAPIEATLTINDHILEPMTLGSSGLNLDIHAYTVHGNNQVTITYPYPADTLPIEVQMTYDYPTLTMAYEDAVFTSQVQEALHAFMRQEAEQGMPGGVLLIARQGQVVFHEAYGNQKLYDGMNTLDAPEPMTKNTLFDLASITKAFAGGLVAMHLETQGLFSADQLLNDYDNALTPAHLFTHSAGFPASFRFFDLKNPKGEGFYSLERNQTMALLPKLNDLYTPGERVLYSDLSYMALTKTLEDAANMDLSAYANQHIYEPLGLTHTLFQPYTRFKSDQIAATERMGNTRDGRYTFDGVRTHTLQGEVHDELAYYSMGEISAHAGLFSNAYDLAVLSQTLLNRGGYGDLRLFSEQVVKAYTTPHPLAARFGLGFDISNHPSNYFYYGLMTSDTGYGKTGWTGTLILIDPTYDLIIILLTNKRHAPFVSGAFVNAQMETSRFSPVVTRIYEHLLDQPAETGVQKTHIPEIGVQLLSLGVDQIHTFSTLLADKKVGLITNTAAFNSLGQTTLEVIQQHTQLTTILAPEHGLHTAIEAGAYVSDTYYEDLKVYSLYGDTRKPTPAMLADLEVLVYDIQDVGSRYYTYIYTMIYAMTAAAENNKPFMVLDRPNPLGDQVLGFPIPEAYESFIGDYGLPHVYGLTVGELAAYINERFEIGCDLTVIPMTGYAYEPYYETGLTFHPPSPNMTNLAAAYLYPGTCLIEGTNLSEGRGTSHPFQMVGAPFINPHVLANALNDYELEGVTFSPISFIPESSKHTDVLCYGVYLEITDWEKINPLTIGVTLLHTLENLYGSQMIYREHLNFLAGMDLTTALKSKMDLELLLDLFETDNPFIEQSRSYQLY